MRQTQAHIHTDSVNFESDSYSYTTQTQPDSDPYTTQTQPTLCQTLSHAVKKEAHDALRQFQADPGRQKQT